MNRKALIGLIVAAGVGIPTIMGILYYYIQSQANSVDIEVTGVEITDVKGSGESQASGSSVGPAPAPSLRAAQASVVGTVKMNVTFTYTIPVSISVKFTASNLSLYYKGGYLGDVRLAENVFDTAKTNVTVALTLFVTNTTSFGQLVEDYIDNDDVDLQVKGSVNFGLISAPLDKQVPAPALGGLKDVVSVNVTSIYEANETSVKLNTTLALHLPVTIDLTVHASNVSVYYKGGYVGDAVLEDSLFSTTETTINASVTVFVTNETALNVLADDFVDLTQVTVQYACTVNLTETIFSNVRAIDVGGNLQMEAMGGLDVSFSAEVTKIYNLTDQRVILNTSFSFSVPSILDLTVKVSNISVNYTGSYLGDGKLANDEFSLAKEHVNTSISVFVVNDTLFEALVNNYTSNAEIQVKINCTANATHTLLSSLQQVEVVKTQTLTGLNGLHDYISAQVAMWDVTLDTSTYASASYTVWVNVTITNPESFSFNLTYFLGWVTFDDTDGVNLGFPPPPTGISYAAKNNVTITPIEKQEWRTNNLKLPGGGSDTQQYPHTGNNLEIGARLFDEYVLKYPMTVDIKNAHIEMIVGKFDVTVETDILGLTVT
ncbi:MAG: DUF3712 domain-containing protein [Promethearchaeota archaeon]